MIARARRRRRRARPRRLPRRGAPRCAEFVLRRDARRRGPPAAHLEGRRGEAERLPRGPRLPARGAADASTRRPSRSRWFDAARETADAMIERFADPERGGFFTTSHDHEELIARRKDIDDHPIPSGNSAAALGLLRLAALTGEHAYEQQAVSVLPALRRGSPPSHPQAFAHLLQALDFHLSPVQRGRAGRAGGGDGLGELAAVVRARLPPAPRARRRRRGRRAPRAAARAARGRRPRRRLRLRALRLPGAGHRARRAERLLAPASSSERQSSRIESPDMAETETDPQTKPQDDRSDRQGVLRCDRRPRPRPRHLAVEAGRQGSHPRHRRAEARPRHQGLLLRPLLGLPRLQVRGPRARRRAASPRPALARHRHVHSAPAASRGWRRPAPRSSIEGCDMLRVEDGLIVENNAYTNAQRSPSSSA